MNRWIDDFHPLWTEVLASPFPVECLQIHLNTSPLLPKISQLGRFHESQSLTTLEIQAIFYRTFKKCKMWTHVCFLQKTHPTCTAMHFSPFSLRGCGIVVMGFPGLETVPERQFAKVVFCDEKCFQNAEAPKEKSSIFGLTTNGQFFQSKNLFYHNSMNGFNVGPSTWILQRYPGFKIAQRASWKPAETTSSSSSCLTVSKKNTARIDTTQIDCFRRPFC